MKATYEINFAKKTVFMSEVFVKKAGCFDTTEFHLRRQMREALPGFEFRMFEDEGNENGRSHGKLTYDVMRDHIKGTESEENVQRVLQELETVIAYSKVHRASYLFVKRWFLEKYKEDFVSAKELRLKELAKELGVDIELLRDDEEKESA